MKTRSTHIHAICAPALLLLSLTAACGTRPDDVLSDDDMCALMTDMYKAGSLLSFDYKMSLNDTSRYKLRQSVLAAHHVSEEKFRKTLDWYGHHIDDYHDIYERMEENLVKESAGNGAESSGSPAAGIWTRPSRLLLSPRTGTQSTRFELSGGEIHQGATLEWDAVAKNAGAGLTFIMGVEYSDGTSEYKRQQYLSAGTVHLALPLDPSRQAQRIFGYSTLGGSAISPVVLDSISLAFTGK